MILPEGLIGSAGFTASSASLAEACAVDAAVFTAAIALEGAAIRLFRSFGSDASATERSITDLPSTSPSAVPLPFSNIISFMGRVSLPWTAAIAPSECSHLSYRGLSPVSSHPRAPEHAARWIPVTSTGDDSLAALGRSLVGADLGDRALAVLQP